MPNHKIAKHQANPVPIKKPKSQEPMIHGGPLAWRFSSCDKNGPFCWNEFESLDKFKEIIEKLHEFETKNWDEIIKGGSHPIEIYKIEKKAQNRLTELNRDDIDELMSFRLPSHQ